MHEIANVIDEGVCLHSHWGSGRANQRDLRLHYPEDEMIAHPNDRHRDSDVIGYDGCGHDDPDTAPLEHCDTTLGRSALSFVAGFLAMAAPLYMINHMQHEHEIQSWKNLILFNLKYTYNIEKTRVEFFVAFLKAEIS